MEREYYFMPDEDVLKRFAAAAGVSVRAVKRYYAWEGSGENSEGTTFHRIEAAARHFPPRHLKTVSDELVPWDYGKDAPAEVFPWERVDDLRPEPERGALGLDLEAHASDRFPVAELEGGRWVRVPVRREPQGDGLLDGLYSEPNSPMAVMRMAGG